MQRWLDRFVEHSELWGFVCIAVFAVMGYIHSPLSVALVGGVLFGLPNLVRMVLKKREHRGVPTDLRILLFYLQALVHGVAAALAGFFIGWGVRAYWGGFP